MLPSLRLRSRALLTRTTLRTYSSEVPKPAANDPKTYPPVQNVSETNAVPTSSEGSMDAVLVESVEAAEAMRTTQAPNRKGIWSRSQQPREKAMVGPRFEQVIMEDQVRTIALCYISPKTMGVVRCNGDVGLVSQSFRDQLLTDIAHTAATTLSHRANSQATRAMEERTCGLLRRWWWTIGTSTYLYQSGQAQDLLVYLLRSSIRTFMPSLSAILQAF